MRVLGFALSLMAALTVLRTTSAAGDAGVTDIMQRDPPKADDLPVTTWFACGMLSGGPCDKSLVSGLVNHLTKDVAVLLQSKTGNEVNVTITSLEELQVGHCLAQSCNTLWSSLLSVWQMHCLPCALPQGAFIDRAATLVVPVLAEQAKY
jgi:hypothetical protein